MFNASYYNLKSDALSDDVCEELHFHNFHGSLQFSSRSISRVKNAGSSLRFR
jgi:hypothetical protein